MRPSPRICSIALGLAATATGAGVRADALTEPMRARNLSPPVAIFGVPTWDGGLEPGRSGRFLLVGDLASHYRFSAAGEETLILDGETWRIDAVWERRLSDTWSIIAELPIVRNSGGMLDDFIDAWHSVFNLPDGNRNLRPEDELQFYYDGVPEPSYFRSQPDTAFGDAIVGFARTAGAERAWLVKLTLKLPTGDADLMAGSGATDVGISVLRRGASTWGSRPAGWYWGASLLRLGEPDEFPARNRDWVGLAVVGVSWQAFTRLGFKAQLDAHTAFYDSALDELGDSAVQATLGGWWSIGARRTLTVAVVEDLIVRAAPDVSIQVGVVWDF